MIETVADANQHFSTRAKVKGVYEIAPSESTMQAKSLVDIAAMLKEIKEGQQVTPILLKRQKDNSQQNSIKYCGICSCNSHHTNECSQFQEDNLNQLRQPYSQPRNNLNTRYLPPHNGQQYPPTNNQQMCEDEILRTLQQGNQETKEFNRQTMIQLNQPLLNPKGGLNAINDKLEGEEEAAKTNNKEAMQQLCEMLIEVPD
ncbi:hypothetical protein PIB30_012233 [Stylosanthes scabra]|uniref:Uncharacterized protein n=1 Tax=Stylosanthes scabra TaxID=79078 RepID=A0ABU6V8L5_9FABA|nr:hypothetical protein [Stylosanthes scabra]